MWREYGIYVLVMVERRRLFGSAYPIYFFIINLFYVKKTTTSLHYPVVCWTDGWCRTMGSPCG